MKAFITGSRAYGTPTEKSDLDLAALVSREDLDTTMMLLPSEPHSHEFGDYPDNCGIFRFGKLNLLLFTDEAEFNAWSRATEYLKAIKPVTRAQAVAAIESQITAITRQEVANAKGAT